MVPISFGLVTSAGAVALFLFIMVVALTVRWRREQVLVDMEAVLSDERLREYVLAQRGRAARRRYRLLTGSTLREARQRVQELIANPDLLDTLKKKRPGADRVAGAGVRNLIAEGRIEDAIEVYRNFMGVDKFTAEQAVAELQREIRLGDDEIIVEEAPEITPRQQERSRWE